MIEIKLNIDHVEFCDWCGVDARPSGMYRITEDLTAWNGKAYQGVNYACTTHAERYFGEHMPLPVRVLPITSEDDAMDLLRRQGAAGRWEVSRKGVGFRSEGYFDSWYRRHPERVSRWLHREAEGMSASGEGQIMFPTLVRHNGFVVAYYRAA